MFRMRKKNCHLYDLKKKKNKRYRSTYKDECNALITLNHNNSLLDSK